MNDIQAPQPNQSLQMLAELFTNALPPMLPPMQFDSGLIPNFFHNWKLKQLDTAGQREASIAQSHSRTAEAKLKTIQDFLTFQARTTDIFKNLEHAEEMRKLDRSVRSEDLKKIQLENQNLYYEAMITEMEFKKRKKEFEEEYEDKKEDI